MPDWLLVLGYFFVVPETIIFVVLNMGNVFLRPSYPIWVGCAGVAIGVGVLLAGVEVELSAWLIAPLVLLPSIPGAAPRTLLISRKPAATEGVRVPTRMKFWLVQLHEPHRQK